MLILRLVQRPDGAPTGSTGRALAPTGSTIGRAPDCDLVLDDPLRMVSRRHAWVVPQAGDQALLRCTSTTSSLLVNGEVLESGAERTVRIGDRLSIGGFEVLLDGDELATVTLPAPTDTVAAPAPMAQWFEPPATEPAPPVREPRLDQWFKLDSIADPLGPGSPLPAVDHTVRAAIRGAGHRRPGVRRRTRAGTCSVATTPHAVRRGRMPPRGDAPTRPQQPPPAPDRWQRPPDAVARVPAQQPRR